MATISNYFGQGLQSLLEDAQNAVNTPMTATQAQQLSQLSGSTTIPYPQYAQNAGGWSGTYQAQLPGITIADIEQIIDAKLKRFLAELVDKLSYDGITIPIDELKKELGNG